MAKLWQLEGRDAPTAADISAAVAAVQAMPDAGDKAHVASVFPIYGKGIPAIGPDDWAASKVKAIKLSDVRATNAQLDRDNLIWHIQHAGQSKKPGPLNKNPQTMQTKKGNHVVIDGHHRLAAYKLLGVNTDDAFVVKKKNLK